MKNSYENWFWWFINEYKPRKGTQFAIEYESYEDFLKRQEAT
jgi:hypothetical protein